MTTPIGTGFESVNVRIRRQLDLYANLRPVKNLPGLDSRFGDVDLIIVRENTEGLYSGLEHEIVPGVVESLKVTTESACTRISRFAFDYARHEGRRRVTAVHKANIMKKSDGLFLECFRSVAVDYPDIECDEKIVDNTCMQLVLDPYQFDVLLMEKTCTAISSPTLLPVSWEVWALSLGQTSVSTQPCSKPCMAARRTSRVRTSPTPRHCCFRLA